MMRTAQETLDRIEALKLMDFTQLMATPEARVIGERDQRINAMIAQVNRYEAASRAMGIISFHMALNSYNG